MAHLEWYYEEREKNDQLHRILSNFPKVGKRNFREAELIGAKAVSIHTPHARHNDERAAEYGEGRSSISVTRGTKKVDAFVNLDDPDGGALAIEGKLNIIRRAAGLA